MRRMVLVRALGDTTTLADSAVVAGLKAKDEEE